MVELVDEAQVLVAQAALFVGRQQRQILAASPSAPSAISEAIRQTRARNFAVASAPAAVHSISRSGGLSDITKNRAVSAPNEAMIFIGSTTFFFDFDILAEGITSTAVPSASLPSATSSGR